MSGEKKLKELQSELNKQINANLKLVAEARTAHRTHEEALEATRVKLEIAEKITIPTLTAAHISLLSRYEAETAIHVRHKVAARPGE
jgi:hypothetical protein